MRKKTKYPKTKIRIDRLNADGTSKHYRSITLDMSPLTAWNCLGHGVSALKGIIINTLRSRRLRPGGKK